MSLKMTAANLVSCDFEIKSGNNKSYCLKLLAYEANESQEDQNDKFSYNAKLSYDLMSGVKKPLCKFRCTFELQYTGNAEGRKLLKEHIVVAHSIPYLREFVSNLTMRTSITALTLEPVNAIQLWDRYRTEKNAKSEK